MAGRCDRPRGRFKARNKNPRRPAWSNKPVVATANPGREFAISRTEPFSGTIEWRYRFDADGEGTLVTESYDVVEPIHPIGWFVIGVIFGRKDRRADLRRGMELTLQRLRDAAEREHTATTKHENTRGAIPSR